MAEKENQHTVPATFLRQFETTEHHLPNHLWCIEIKNEYAKKPFLKGVNSKLFTEKNFYSLNGFKDKLIVEDFYGEYIEPTYNDIILEINTEKNLSEQNRVNLIQWIMHSNHRTEYNRNNIARIANWLMEMQQKVDKSKNKTEIDSESSAKMFNVESLRIAKTIQLEHVLNDEYFEKMIERYCSELVPKRWVILKAKEENPFIGNDNPGFSLNTSHLNREQVFNLSIHLNHPSFNYLILSPKYCLFIEPFRESDPIYLNAMNMEIHYKNIDDKLIDFINYGTFSTATKYIISNKETIINKWFEK